MSDDDILPIGQFDGCNDSISSNESETLNSISYPIPVLISNQFLNQKNSQVGTTFPASTPRFRCQNSKKSKIKQGYLRTIKRSNKTLQALELPTVINLNPRSVYNKIDEFHDLVSELKVDCVFMSESWECEALPLIR